MLLEENKPLAPYTTFGIGGPARFFCEATSEEEIAEATAWAEARNAPLVVLGGGSNLLVSDAGFDGLALRVGLRGITAVHSTQNLNTESRVCQGTTSVVPQMPQNENGALAPEGQIIYQVAAGEDWDRFVERTVEDNCAGVECLAGIPGTVGGTPVQNVGAYGQEVASSIHCVRAFDLQARSFVEFAAAECGFAYRRSRFNSADRGRFVVTRVDYRLTPGGAPTVRYADLQRALADALAEGTELSLAEVAAAVRRIRQSKGMLIVEGDPDCRSAGSFFKNPIVTEDQLRSIAAVSALPPPRFPAGAGTENQGRVKIPAAWLIEQAGFSKGYTLGAAAISSRHTLALTNRGAACAGDVLALAAKITAAVEERFAIRLEMEPVLVGF
jgi:UDP-N-acetylmuramate dehydrogenase